MYESIASLFISMKIDLLLRVCAFPFFCCGVIWATDFALCYSTGPRFLIGSVCSPNSFLHPWALDLSFVITAQI
jgi:hypothetical protein